ncbi:MAG TPA: M1 family metallopeptidase [Gemmatimonadaceae bacterium]|jgi:hypothetical protein
MNLTLILGVSALFQQGTFQGATSPASGDTTGYWQQRVQYSIVATLNEEQDKLQATGRLVYKNNSPDTLREMFFHQYLNAFRPGSKWSAVDVHENRVRFQMLGPNDIGYERLTQAPTFDGTPLIVDYPGAPDSTVMHFRLPKPLAPGDSAVINFAWDARPSTVPRRQARRGRTYDFAQWFPKVAVYDERGWEPNPLVPAGELYGEFGDYDVTMVVKDDQVLASTGVPVNGDPGWARVSRTGPPYLASNAYGEIAPNGVTAPAGYRTVRFVAKNVHHFAWSASPDYRYEGGTYVRDVERQHFQTWDTVGVNVLFKPGDDSIWGGGRAVQRTITAAKWLESLWGPYAYPQITNIHRIDPGGTEFPMMIMDGDADQDLILHEFGHVFTYGILANNEWRSGWLDEGLTTFQTEWAQHLSPQDRDRIAPPPRLAEGYRVNAETIAGRDSSYLSDTWLDFIGRSQPIGTPAYDFSEFAIYNEMIYNRAALMYGQLREMMGDSVFHVFAHDYYTRWTLKHVDERAMRTAAERAYGKPLGWFFDQWVHRVGLMDYAMGSYRINRAPDGYEILANVARRGDLRHPMPVGVLTQSGWTIVRADPTLDNQRVRIVTREAPKEITLDPYHATYDWDRRNDTPPAELLFVIPEPKFVFNWPYLAQSDRSHTIVALSPDAWYSNPQRVTAGIRATTNYLSSVDQYDMGLAFAAKNPTDALGNQPNRLTRVNAWVRFDNPYLPGMSRPAMGFGGDANYLDGLLKADLYKNWDLSPFIGTPGPKIGVKAYANVSMPTDSMLLPEQWSKIATGELGAVASYRTPTIAPDSDYIAMRGSLAVGGGMAGDSSEPSRGYVRGEGSVTGVRSIVGTASQVRVRAYGAFAPNAPLQRKIFASSVDPLESFNNDLFRARGALFKQQNVNYLPIGGAGLRGFAVNIPLDAVVAVNGELLQRLGTVRGQWGNATFSLSGFGDVARGSSDKYIYLTNSFLSDAGAGIVARGRLFDRGFNVRLDVPFFVNQAGLAGWPAFGHDRNGGSVASRWVLTIGDVFF